MKNIYQSIPAIIADIEAIRKTKKEGAAIKYAYRGIDDFMNALNPLLAKHKVTIVPEVKDNLREPITTANGAQMISVVLKMNYKVYAEDGTFIEGATIGESFDSGDKASNKAMSVALKYFVMQLFMVPTEDIDDPDNHDTEGLRGTQPKSTSAAIAKHVSQQEPKSGPTGSPPALASAAQVLRLWAIQRNSDKSIADVIAKMKEKYQVTEAEKLTWVQYGELIKWVENK